MDILEKLNSVNDVPIVSVFSEDFAQYGRVLEGFDFSSLTAYMEEKTEIPENGNVYVASVEEMEKFVTEKLSDIELDKDYDCAIFTGGEERFELLTGFNLVDNTLFNDNIHKYMLSLEDYISGTKKVFYSASIHANEWITSVLLMKFIEDYCIAYNNNSRLYGHSVRRLFNSVSIYIMPIVNPDGVDLVTGNLNKTSLAFFKALNISRQFPDIPFPSRMEG